MTVKNLFRRVNRGIVLAAVLLVGLIGYLLFDAITFSTEKETIKAMVSEYADLAGQIMVLPENARIPGKPAPADAVKAKIEDGKLNLGQYLTNNTDRRNTPMLDSVLTSLEYSFENNQHLCAYVLECDFTVIDVKGLKKHGADTATGDIVVKTAIKTIGSPDYIKLFWQQNVTDNMGFISAAKMDGEQSDTEEVIDEETHTMSNTVTFEDVVFKKDNGKWKIASASRMSFISDGAMMGVAY